LATSVSWGADDLVRKTPGVESPDDVAAPELADDATHRAVEDAGRIAERAVREAEKFGKLAKEQVMRGKDEAVRQVKRAIDMAHAKCQLAEHIDVNENNNLATAIDGGGFAFASGGRTSTQPLIIRASELDAGTAASLQEDLSVMS